MIQRIFNLVWAMTVVGISIGGSAGIAVIVYRWITGG